MFKNVIINVIIQSIYLSGIAFIFLHRIGYLYCLIIGIVIVLYITIKETYSDRKKRYDIISEYTYFINKKEYKEFIKNTLNELKIKAENYYSITKNVTINLIKDQHLYCDMGIACAMDDNIYIDYDFFVYCLTIENEEEKNMIKALIAHEMAHIYSHHTTFGAMILYSKNITNDIFEIIEFAIERQKGSNSIIYAIACYVIFKPLFFIHNIIFSHVEKNRLKEKRKQEYKADEFTVITGYSDAMIRYLDFGKKYDVGVDEKSTHPQNQKRINYIMYVKDTL